MGALMVNKEIRVKKEDFLQKSSVTILKEAELPWEIVKKQLEDLDSQFRSVYDRLESFEKIAKILHIEELETFSNEARDTMPIIPNVKKVALELICTQKDEKDLEDVVNSMVEIVGNVYEDLHSLADSAIQPESHLKRIKNVKNRLEECESSTFRNKDALLSGKNH
jgi:hypothetical protein